MIWTLLIVSLSFWAIMISVYAIFYGFTKHIFEKYKIYYEILVGVIFGIMSLLSTMATLKILEIFNLQGNRISMYLPIVTMWVLFYAASPLTTLFLICINFMQLFLLPDYFAIFIRPSNNFELVIIGISYLIPFAILTLTFIFEKLKNQNFLFLIVNNTIILIISILFILPVWNEIYKIDDLIIILWTLAVCYATYGSAVIINQIHSHALKLRNITEFDNEYYIINAHANDETLNFIQRKKIEKGFYVNFFIANHKKLEEKVNSNIRESIISTVTKEVYTLFSEAFKDNVIFFKKNYKLFGMFIKTEKFNEQDLQIMTSGNNNEIRIQEDRLKEISELFKKINTNFKFENFFIKMKLKIVVSLYGIHTNNLDTLYEINNYYIKNENKEIIANKVLFANPLKVNLEMRQTRKLLSLSEIVPLNQNVTTYKSVYGTDENNIIGYSLSNVIDGNYIEDESFDKFNKIIKKGGLESLFQRFIALENMKDAQKNLDKIKDLKLFIKYDVQHVASQDFSINEIVLKIKKTKLIKKNICLYFNDETEIQNIEILEKNIQQLKKMGILIGYRMKLNSDFNIKVFGIFKPDYVIVYGSKLSDINKNKEYFEIVKELLKILKKFETKVIFSEVDNYANYKILKGLGAEYFEGKLIKTNNKIDVELSNELKILLAKN